MKKHKLPTELIESISRILRNNYKISFDAGTEKRLIFINDPHDVSEQIVRVLISTELFKILESVKNK